MTYVFERWPSFRKFKDHLVHCLHFTDEETEAPKDKITCPSYTAAQDRPLIRIQFFLLAEREFILELMLGNLNINSRTSTDVILKVCS